MQQVRYTVLIVERGWPALTIGMEWWNEFHYPNRIQWQCNGYPVAGGHIPIRPLGIGFAINTLFYATLLWLLICGPFILRRLVRVKRGLCPRGAYTMGESAVCSECGTQLPTHVRAAT